MLKTFLTLKTNTEKTEHKHKSFGGVGIALICLWAWNIIECTLIQSGFTFAANITFSRSHFWTASYYNVCYRLNNKKKSRIINLWISKLLSSPTILCLNGLVHFCLAVQIDCLTPAVRWHSFIAQILLKLSYSGAPILWSRKWICFHHLNILSHL